MLSLIAKIFGDPSEKKLKKYKNELEQIKKIEIGLQSEIKTLEEVQAKTHAFQSLFQGLDITDSDDRTKIREILESIKLEAIALHRRACTLIYGKTFDLSNDKKIEWNMIPYDMQVVGALALHEGNIAEMRTGE